MRVTTVKEVLGMEVGTSVKGFRGKVKKVFPQKGGIGKNGRDWTMQGVVCLDGSFEIQLTFWNRDTIKPFAWEGKELIVMCNGEKEMEVAEYKNKNQLSVPEDAEVQVGSPSAGKAHAPGISSPDRALPSGETPVTYAARCASAMGIALNAAYYTGEQFNKAKGGIFVDGPGFTQIACSVFEAMDRAGLVAVTPRASKGGTTRKQESQPDPPPEEDPPPPPDAPATNLPEDSDVPF